MKTAAEILSEYCENEGFDNFTELIRQDPSIIQAIVLKAMKEYAEQEREKAFNAGFKKGNENGLLHPDDDSYDKIKRKSGLKEYKQQNPL